VYYVDANPMGALSLRLPDDLEQQLSQEARLSGQSRSQLLREALDGLLCRRRQERAQAALRGAASALAADPSSREEVLEIAADFLPAENEALARAAVLAGEPKGEPWWR
jgi:predicted transcriptional regulator